MNKQTRSSALLALMWGAFSAAIAIGLFLLGKSADTDPDLRTATTRLGVAAVAFALVGAVGGAWILARGRSLPAVGVVAASVVVGCAAALGMNSLFVDGSLLAISIPLAYVAFMVWRETAGRKHPESQA